MTSNSKQTQISSSSAQGFTFGIEIETMMPNSLLGEITIGQYHRGWTIPTGKAGFPGTGWQVMRDGSLSTTLSTHTPAEFVAPILRGREGMEEVLAVANWMETQGFKTNASCGTHVHVGYESVVGSSDENAIGHWAANLVNLVAQYEAAIRGAAGSYSRVTGSWCRTIRNSDHRESARRARTTSRNKIDALCAEVADGYSARYHILNLTRLAARKATVEFRAFTGTTSGLKMVSWIQLCLALCERAAGQGVRFDAPTTACYRGAGDASKALARFFYVMGWTLGKKDKNAAQVEASGWVLDPSALKATKKELKRLAAKFDAEAAGRCAA